MDNLKKTKRAQMVEYFRQTARNENLKNQGPIDFEKILDNTGKKRVIIIMPGTIGDLFCLTALFPDIRARFPKETYILYVSTKKEYRNIVECCEEIDRWIEFNPQFENSSFLHGINEHKGYFEISYHPYKFTQRDNWYTQNGHSNFGFSLEK